MNTEFDLQNKKIKTQSEEIKLQKDSIISLEDKQKDLLKTIDIQIGNIKHLQKTVDDYKKKCDNCQFKLVSKE